MHRPHVNDNSKQQAIICNKEESCRSNQCMPAVIKTYFSMIPESSHYANKKLQNFS
jgi:hypothetical protein